MITASLRCLPNVIEAHARPFLDDVTLGDRHPSFRAEGDKRPGNKQAQPAAEKLHRYGPHVCVTMAPHESRHITLRPSDG
jgi:hypothetical protein